MPPCGYTPSQSKSIIEFLRSVSTSLREEGRGFELTPTEALQRELNNIAVILDSDENFGASGNKVLELTASFYQQILDRGPVNYQDFDDIRSILLKETDAQILRIHVPSIEKLRLEKVLSHSNSRDTTSSQVAQKFD
jgi:hypothetical protein